MACNVCLEEFTSSLKKEISCPFCKASTCLKCSKTFALTHASGPKCASCSKAFTQDQIEAMFTKNFRRGALRIQAINNLLEQEMSLLPETLQRINEDKARQVYYTCHVKMTNLGKLFMENPLQDTDLIYNEFKKIQNVMRECGFTPLKKVVKEIQRKSVKCPGECAGFIFFSGPGSGTCGICDLKLCLDCNSVRTKDHICNPDDVKSFTLIKDSCVQCPKCATQIQKISGCNQKWCTATDCNTAFDWVSGRVINGPIHNPHYHVWIAQGGAQAAPQNCDEPRNAWNGARLGLIYDSYEHTVHLRPEQYRDVKQYLRALPESFDVFRRYPVYGPMTYEILRQKYLKGQLTKSQWASNLSHNETLRSKNEKLSQVYIMFQMAATDIFNQFYNDTFEAVSKPDCATVSVRNRYNVMRIIKVIDENKSYVNFSKFLSSVETLRKYHSTEIVKILDDYSDTTALVLDWYDEDKLRNLRWARKPIKTIKS